MALLVVLMGIIVKKLVTNVSIMGSGTMNMWHHMYVHRKVIATWLLHKWHIYNNFKIIVTCNYNAIPQKMKHD